jgi:ribosomal protein L37E
MCARCNIGLNKDTGEYTWHLERKDENMFYEKKLCDACAFAALKFMKRLPREYKGWDDWNYGAR